MDIVQKKFGVQPSLNVLQEEARSFDTQIEKRGAHGHVPDLRNSGRCEWFYNNVWRDQVYADLFYGEIVRQIIAYSQKHLDKPFSKISILEIACGPGHISLELARNGCSVVGIDLSPGAIEIARQTALASAPEILRGSLKYLCGDVDQLVDDGGFDLIVFCNALHHFGDQEKILAQASRLLAPDGLVYVSEPVREKMRNSDALLIHLIRELLVVGDRYYTAGTMTTDPQRLQQILDDIKNEFGYRDASGGKVQSPLDNEASFSTMYPVLQKTFDELEMQKDFAFFDRVVGGLRLATIDQEQATARWLAMVDRLLCKDDIIQPGQFHFVGRKQNIATTA